MTNYMRYLEEKQANKEKNNLINDIENRPLPNNYLYISHLDDLGDDFKFWYLPFYPETVTDSMRTSFQETQALGRSAPVFTYSSSGPRTVQINLKLHREMMDYANNNVNSSVILDSGEDYMDSLIHALQSIALPNYDPNSKAVEPPLVALRLGNEIFVKGIVNDSIGISYEKPILYNEKYAQVSLSLTITEVDPYDALTVFHNGSFRGWVKTLKQPWSASSSDASVK